jgi:hypothetical protein
MPVVSEIPAERKDFARFLQRGLEQDKRRKKKKNRLKIIRKKVGIRSSVRWNLEL